MAHRIYEVSLGGYFSDPDYPHYTRLPLVTPTAVTGYETTLQSGNVVHQILGSRVPAVTYRPAGLRTGTLELHFEDTRSAMQCESLHTYGRILQLAVDVPDDGPYDGLERLHVADATSMFYVANGNITRRRTDVDTWIVTVDYQEVQGPQAMRIWT